jgi:hypothetical protein
VKSTRKLLLVTLALAFLAPATALAHYVKSPLSGTVTATTYYSSGKFHGALDIAGPASTCGTRQVTTGVAQTKYWTVTIRTTSRVCYGNGSGRENSSNASYANGWTFRQFHFNRNSNSRSRTCDRCYIGTHGGTGNSTGPHTHIQYDRYGTRSTSWYSVGRGRSVTTTTNVGYLP